MPRLEGVAPEARLAAAKSHAPSDAPVLLSTRGLFKTYRKGDVSVPVLRGVDLDVRRGEFVAVVGQSGSGKSTLLHLLGTLDRPDAGEVSFEGNRVDNLPAAGKDVLRNRHIGMIFQAYHLVPELTALENVLTPAMIRHSVLAYWWKRREHQRQARRLLEMVELDHRMRHKPRELSGGEMQRAAIARALMSRPRVLLADEPTGNLDQQTGEGVLDLLERLNREQGLTLILVTHDPRIAERAHRVVMLADGHVQDAARVAA